jgi:hypothetical protein
MLVGMLMVCSGGLDAGIAQATSVIAPESCLVSMSYIDKFNGI